RSGSLQPRSRDVRRVRHVPPRGLRRVRAVVGALGGDVGAPARGPRRGRPVSGRTLFEHDVTLWHGRFADGPAEELLAFTESLSFDRRLAPDDLAGSRAHVMMLAHTGLLTGEEAALVRAALDRVEIELIDGTLVFTPGDEDIHTAIERRVTEL